MPETDPADARLRHRFAALADEDARMMPPFAVPTRRRARGVGRRSLAVAAAAAVVLLAGAGSAWWLLRAPAAPPYPIDLAAVTWTAPTDFLLDTPGRALLREVPSFTTGAGATVTDASVITDDTLRRTPS